MPKSMYNLVNCHKLNTSMQLAPISRKIILSASQKATHMPSQNNSLLELTVQWLPTAQISCCFIEMES